MFKIFSLLFYDTWLTYWHVLLLTMIIAQFRGELGRKWIMVASVLLVVFVVGSEISALHPDKDGVFILGSIIRLIVALGILLTAALALEPLSSFRSRSDIALRLGSSRREHD